MTAIDGGYICKFLATYPTWATFKPEILEMPLRIIYDAASLSPGGPRMRRLAWIARKHPDFKFIPWGGDYPTQREKMLSSLVFLPAEHVETPWYLKIDADTVATREGKWLQEEWFDGDPAFVTNPWRYTKPASFLDALDDWGDGVPELAKYPPLRIPHEPRARRAYHDRIISWLFLGNTVWTREVAALMPGRRLPVPSQDTALWYVAARTRRRFELINFKRHGWGHCGRRRTSAIAERCRSLLSD